MNTTRLDLAQNNQSVQGVTNSNNSQNINQRDQGVTKNIPLTV